MPVEHSKQIPLNNNLAKGFFPDNKDSKQQHLATSQEPNCLLSTIESSFILRPLLGAPLRHCLTVNIDKHDPPVWVLQVLPCLPNCNSMSHVVAQSNATYSYILFSFELPEYVFSKSFCISYSWKKGCAVSEFKQSFASVLLRLDRWESEGLPLSAPADAGWLCAGERERRDVGQMAEKEDQQQACRYNH